MTNVGRKDQKSIHSFRKNKEKAKNNKTDNLESHTESIFLLLPLTL